MSSSKHTIVKSWRHHSVHRTRYCSALAGLGFAPALVAARKDWWSAAPVACCSHRRDLCFVVHQRGIPPAVAVAGAVAVERWTAVLQAVLHFAGCRGFALRTGWCSAVPPAQSQTSLGSASMQSQPEQSRTSSQPAPGQSLPMPSRTGLQPVPTARLLETRTGLRLV
jgi:hypothetical protein